MIGKHLLAAITDGTALNEPWRLTLFLVLSYADLKKYRFHYWAAYPTPFNLPEMYYQCPAEKIHEILSEKLVEKLKINFHELDCRSKGFFSLIVSNDDDDDDLKIISLAEGVEMVKNPPEDPDEVILIFNLFFSFLNVRKNFNY